VGYWEINDQHAQDDEEMHLQDGRARLARRVDPVHLVCFVHLISLVQPNKPNKQEKLADSRASRPQPMPLADFFSILLVEL
jgi:hypothetical protein